MTRRPLFVLAVLYVVQGLPYGFQTGALGPYLRSEGVRLADVGFAGALAAPWALKVLWAPLVDGRGGRLGRRRSWIVPMQALLALTCFATAALPEHGAITPLLVAVLFMNLFAATMDIAVDGLAIDLLRGRELGLGNAAQVGGYKIGMLIGGGLLAGAARWIGSSGHFAAMGALVLVAMAITLAHAEPPPEAERAHTSVRDVLAALRRVLARPDARVVILVVATYKLGESLVDPMWPAMLVDHGIAREDVALWNGGAGMAASIAGSLVGGALASAVSAPRALSIAGAARAIAIALQLAVATGSVPDDPATVLGVIATEHFLAGALSTTLFTFMMGRTDRAIGATHYTLLATIEVLGKAPLSLLSGVIAERIDYPATFAIGLGLSLAWSLGVVFLPRSAR